MRKYIIFSLSCDNTSIIEDILTNDILKNYPYGAKYKTQRLCFDNILIPALDDIIPYDEMKPFVVYTGKAYDDNILSSVCSVIKKLFSYNTKPSINIINTFSDDKLGISYTDGSFSTKNENTAGYACCHLLSESTTGMIDDFTGKAYSYNEYYGNILDGTNNIGELTGIKVAIENFDDRPYQLIISDSIYGIRSYREYIHNWKTNGYKTYAKKPIKNKELILETYDLLQEAQKNKMVFFKWTKGHVGNNFNTRCDELAKSAINI